MASSKKRSRAVITVVVCLLAVCIVAAATCFGLVSHKVKTIQAGGTFDFDYTITPTTADTPALYGILKEVDAAEGSVSGQYLPGKLQVSLSAKGAASPVTRVYIDENETLYDAGQLYTTLRSELVDAYPLAGMFLPSWTLGSYISQTQLAQVLGVDLQAVELQDMSGFTLALGALQRVSPENAKAGYTYFQLPTADANAPQLIVGLPLKSFFDKSTPLHVLLTIPAHSVRVELTGTLTPANPVITAPASRMSDEDVASFTQIRQTIQQVIQTLSEFTQRAS